MSSPPIRLFAIAETAEAESFADAWHERWGGFLPDPGQFNPGVASDCRHAYPDFRNPLTREEAFKASADLFATFVERLAAGNEIAMVTSDSLWQSEEGEFTTHPSTLEGLIERDLVWGMVEDEVQAVDDLDDGLRHLTNIYVTHLLLDDPRLAEIWERCTKSYANLLVVGADHSWAAVPDFACLRVISFDQRNIETLYEIADQVWGRWGVAHERSPLINLADVAAYIEQRRGAWGEAGVQLDGPPTYLVWSGPSAIGWVARDEIAPEDRGCIDKMSVVLRCGTFGATMVIHDLGCASLQVYTVSEDEDEDDEILIDEDAGPADSLGLEGIAEYLERAVVALRESAGRG